VFLNEPDGDIEGKARDGDAHLRIDDPLSLARVRLEKDRARAVFLARRTRNPRLIDLAFFSDVTTSGSFRDF